MRPALVSMLPMLLLSAAVLPAQHPTPVRPPTEWKSFAELLDEGMRGDSPLPPTGADGWRAEILGRDFSEPGVYVSDAGATPGPQLEPFMGNWEAIDKSLDEAYGGAHNRPTMQLETLKGGEFELEPEEVMSPDHASRVWKLLRRPLVASSAAIAGMSWIDSGQPKPPAISVQFIATGEASGNAFTMIARNRTNRRVRIAFPDGLVLAPAGRAPASAMSGIGGKGSQKTVFGYCVEFAKEPPSAGSLFRIAPRSVQQQFREHRNILRAGRFLHARKLLDPAQPDADRYGHSILQWALWSRLEHWDQRRFTDQFVQRTRKNVADAKGRWTGDVERLVQSSAVTRWRDIRGIWHVADLIAREEGGRAHAK